MSEFGYALRRHWRLEAGVRFLNHGSFGATPEEVLAAQSSWRDRMERQPVRFLTRELPVALCAVRERLAAFLHADPAGLAFVDNATAGVNSVLRSLSWHAGDVLVLGSHAYGAVQESVRYLVDRYGVEVRVAEIPFPVSGPMAVIDAYRAVIVPGVRLAILDHVTSPSALVLPVGELVALCREHGVAALVDGAHAPGMLALDLAQLGADWYVGNCHKWLFAPKGCAFLWTAPAERAGTHPLAISKHYGAGYLPEFDWTGTRDPSPWLALTAALDFHARLGGDALCRHNHALVRQAAAHCHEAWGTTSPAPAAMLGAMATLALPAALAARPSAADWLHEQLWTDQRIEVPPIVLAGRLWLRISAQAYNEPAEFAALAAAVSALAARA